MPRFSHSIFLAVIFWTAVFSTARAEVVRFEMVERKSAGAAGYEMLVGRLHFEIDPASPPNRVITDIGLAPVNARGQVEFSSDVRIWRPVDEARSNGAAWVEIPNRGGGGNLPAKQVTEGGFTQMSVGWEFDIPSDGKKLSIKVPVAREKDGRPIRGVVKATFTPNQRVEERVTEAAVPEMETYLPADANGPDSRLVARKAMAFPEGTEVPRSLWRIEKGRVKFEGGFEAGTTYEVQYLAENPPVAGLGHAAIRDAVAWLKHDPASPARVKHAYAFGSSQCGRLLREYMYLGFNTDEKGRLACDGVIAHVAGAGRLLLNRRWCAPRAIAAYETAAYPFADTAQPDPVTGASEGLLENPRVKQFAKVFYINTGSEYWGAGRVAGLTHTNAEGTQDVLFPEHVRSYFYSGTQHGPGPFPPRGSADDAPFMNPVNAGAITLSLRTAMHNWVTEAKLPPDSVYPRLSDGTLARASDVRFPKLPRMLSPHGVKAGPRLPNVLLLKDGGAGTELPLLVPQVDADGNDLGGIRMPEVAVPLATATGWVPRSPSTGATHDLVALRGAWIPFAVTRAQREKTGDARPSVEERYASKEDYLKRIDEAAHKLISQGFLTEADLGPIRKTAVQHWDWVTSANPGVASKPASPRTE